MLLYTNSKCCIDVLTCSRISGADLTADHVQGQAALVLVVVVLLLLLSGTREVGVDRKRKINTQPPKCKVECH